MPHETKRGLNFISRTIERFVQAGGIDHVAIGTDFDGFTDPPDDLKDSSEIRFLTQRLISDNYSEEQIKKILGINALRVLQGNRPVPLGDSIKEHAPGQTPLSYGVILPPVHYKVTSRTDLHHWSEEGQNRGYPMSLKKTQGRVEQRIQLAAEGIMAPVVSAWGIRLRPIMRVMPE